jgi:outer membrane protein OmpA-like peptidoglycan-associated protein
MAQYHANKGDGSILMSLPLNQTFSYSVRAYNCTSSEGTINFPEACPKWCELTFALLPRDYVKPTKDSLVLTVQFAKNVITLNDTQIVAIESTLREWMGKEDLAIFINSYTDNTGTPLINTEKSTIRANVIANIVTKMGFEPQIITSTGFGEANPVVPNDSPENQNLNRRVEIVLHWSY